MSVSLRKKNGELETTVWMRECLVEVTILQEGLSAKVNTNKIGANNILSTENQTSII